MYAIYGNIYHQYKYVKFSLQYLESEPLNVLKLIVDIIYL